MPMVGGGLGSNIITHSTQTPSTLDDGEYALSKCYPAISSTGTPSVLPALTSPHLYLLKRKNPTRCPSLPLDLSSPESGLPSPPFSMPTRRSVRPSCTLLPDTTTTSNLTCTSSLLHDSTRRSDVCRPHRPSGTGQNEPRHLRFHGRGSSPYK